MKKNQPLSVGIAFAMLTSPGLKAEETPPEIAGLEKAAADFVIAFNKKDAAAVAALFTEQGEITDLNGEEITTGRSEIQARYEALFAASDAPMIAVEVDSVRLVGRDLAIEDGTAHLTPPGDDAPARSSTYTAVLQKSDAGIWQIASTRDLKDVTGPAGQLDELVESLKGDWTGQKGDLRLDLAFGWDDSGKFLSGQMLATKSDAKPATTTLRFGWDGARKTISCWTFDSGGGFAKADWAPNDEGWQIRTEGTTADGETMSANQTLVFEGKDTFIWTVKDRLVDGESLPDSELRVVRRAPEPAAE
jgi:uncharacterized protein (TIGR02246 family)